MATLCVNIEARLEAHEHDNDLALVSNASNSALSGSVRAMGTSRGCLKAHQLRAGVLDGNAAHLAAQVENGWFAIAL